MGLISHEHFTYDNPLYFEEGADEDGRLVDTFAGTIQGYNNDISDSEGDGIGSSIQTFYTSEFILYTLQFYIQFNV